MAHSTAIYAAECARARERSGLLLGQMAHTGKRREHASMQAAATDIYRTLQLLRNFCILNYTG